MSAKVKHILVDMDGVLADWAKGVERQIRYGGRADLADSLDWSLWAGTSDPETLAAVREAQAGLHFYFWLAPIKGAIDALREMVADGHLVTICSTPDSTNPTCADDKIAWLETKVGPGWGKRLILTHDKTLVRGDILIDDKPNITGARHPEWTHVLFNQPYNQEPSNKARLFQWSGWRNVIQTRPAYANGGYFCANGPRALNEFGEWKVTA